MLINPDEHRFTMAEVVGDSTINATNLRNWMARDVLIVGQKHKLGRWLFSISDIIKIRVVQSLTAMAMMPPNEAHKIAHRLVVRYRELVTPNADGTYPIVSELRIGTPKGRKCFVVTAGSDGPFGHEGTFRDDGEVEFDLGYNDEKFTLERFQSSPYLMVPVDEMIARTVMDFTLQAMDEEGEDWGKLGFPANTKEKKGNAYAAAVSVDGMIHLYSLAPIQPKKESFKERLSEAALNVRFDDAVEAINAVIAKNRGSNDEK